MDTATPPPHASYEWTPEFWKGWRERQNRYRRYKSERDRRLALALLQPRDGERIVEVGCGYGWISEALWDAARIQWLGMDRSASMLQDLRKRARERPLVRADACRLPLGDARFDKVLCSGVLMHVPEAHRALREFVRILRPGGTLVFTINNIYSPLALPLRVHNLKKRGFVQEFRRPGAYVRMLREFGMSLTGMAGDRFLATNPWCIGRFSIPPQAAFSVLQPLDEWIVTRFPWLAFEVWLRAVKDGRSIAPGEGVS
jgi:SAM-dependent methyltransferase